MSSPCLQPLCSGHLFYTYICTVHEKVYIIIFIFKDGEFHQQVAVGFWWHWTRKDGHQCETSYARQINVFDQQGK